MHRRSRASRFIASLGFAAAIAAPAVSVVAQPASAPPRTVIRGAVEALSGNVLTVRTANGAVAVTLAPDASVRVVQKESLADIKPGSYVGAAAVPEPDGTLRALVVQIFPAGVHPPEGSTPYDLAPGSSMTNATVQKVDGESVAGVENRTLTLVYNGSEKKVIVPANVPVVTSHPGDRSLLVPGARVYSVARANAAGVLTANNVTVGSKGVDPPM